jgi:hypothetical protein
MLFGGMCLGGFGQTTTIKIKKDTTINVYNFHDSLLIMNTSKVKRAVIIVRTFRREEKTNTEKIFERLTLRQSFQSTNAKAEDAFANLVFPKDSVSSQNFSFALGLNILGNRQTATLTPFLEWQRNTLVSKKQNTLLAGINFQTPLWSALKRQKQWTIFLVSTANYKNDIVKSTKGTQINAYFTPIFNGRNRKFYFLPDADMENGALKVNYNLYAGMEFENRARALLLEQEGKVWRNYLRVIGRIYPLPKLLDERLEIIPDYTYRNSFSREADAEKKINGLWRLSFNLVLVKKSKSGIADVKLAFDHLNGSDPTTGFEKETVNTLTLKLKI